jgi:hypothetical protein
MTNMLSRPTSRLARIAAIAVFTLVAAVVIPAAPALAAEGEGCPNEQVRHESNTNPATGQPYSVGLPECRAYEMVSPLDKQSHSANVSSSGPLVSPDGDAVGFGSQGAFAGAENYVINLGAINTYIARRSADGWVTESALAPASVISKPTYDGFNGDASLDLSTLGTCGNVDFTTALGSSPNFACAIREPGGTWAKTPSYTDQNGETPEVPVVLWGSSSDLSDMVWQPFGGKGFGILPGDKVGEIYETTGLGGPSPQLREVSVNNEGTPLTAKSSGGITDQPYIGAVNAIALRRGGSAYQAISSDGQTVYFTAEPAGGGPLTLYARTGDFAGGTPASPVTVTIAEEATYVGASRDGSKVFFTTTQQLAPTDTDSTSDLYEYDFDSPAGHHYIQVSAGGLGDPSPGSGADVESHGVVGISSDGSHVYFSSSAVLTTSPNGNGEHAVTGQGGHGGTYGYDTETGQTQFVGDVGGPSCPYAEPGCDSPQVTPDGRYLIVVTTTHPSSEDTNSGTAVYRYDFQTGDVTWVSHAAPGFTALNEGDSATLPEREGELQADGAMAYFGDARRAISENGEYIIFSTAEKLQADDVSGAPALYLWHNGTVSLISDGVTTYGEACGHSECPQAPGISASGADIVFATTSKLVGQDTDNFTDIYDARIDGGFPAPTPEPACAGEACQGSPPASPAFGTPGTASSASGGNLTPGSTSFPPPEESKPKPLTRAQKLAKALKQCKKDKAKKKRLACEKEAKKKYGPKATKNK